VGGFQSISTGQTAELLAGLGDAAAKLENLAVGSCVDEEL
jgi:hypothetical protein